MLELYLERQVLAVSSLVLLACLACGPANMPTSVGAPGAATLTAMPTLEIILPAPITPAAIPSKRPPPVPTVTPPVAARGGNVSLSTAFPTTGPESTPAALAVTLEPTPVAEELAAEMPTPTTVPDPESQLTQDPMRPQEAAVEATLPVPSTPTLAPSPTPAPEPTATPLPQPTSTPTPPPTSTATPAPSPVPTPNPAPTAPVLTQVPMATPAGNSGAPVQIQCIFSTER